MKITAENETKIMGTVDVRVPLAAEFAVDIDGNASLKLPVRQTPGSTVALGGVTWEVDQDGVTLRAHLGVKGFGVMRVLRALEDGQGTVAVAPQPVLPAQPTPAAGSRAKKKAEAPVPTADAQSVDPAPQVEGREAPPPKKAEGMTAVTPTAPVAPVAPKIAPPPAPPSPDLDFSFNDLGSEAVAPASPPKPAAPAAPRPPSPPTAPPPVTPPAAPTEDTLGELYDLGLPREILTKTNAVEVISLCAKYAYDALAEDALNAGNAGPFFAVEATTHMRALGDWLNKRLSKLPLFQLPPNPQNPQVGWDPRMFGALAIKHIAAYHKQRQAEWATKGS